jgi:hypothetical protein
MPPHRCLLVDLTCGHPPRSRRHRSLVYFFRAVLIIVSLFVLALAACHPPLPPHISPFARQHRSRCCPCPPFTVCTRFALRAFSRIKYPTDKSQTPRTRPAPRMPFEKNTAPGNLWVPNLTHGHVDSSTSAPPLTTADLQGHLRWLRATQTIRRETSIVFPRPSSSSSSSPPLSQPSHRA